MLSKKGLQHLIAETLENCLSVQVQSYLKKVKTQAKVAFDQVCSKPSLQVDAITLLSNNPNSIIYKRQQTDSYPDSKEFTNWLQSHMDSKKADSIRQQFTDFNNFLVSVREKRKAKPILFKEPAEIPRTKLIEALTKMRTNFYHKLKTADDDDLHSVPIQDMGNYHEYLKNQAPPLRELETQLVRQHMFGNPFKLVSKGGLLDEVELDEAIEESAENNNQYQKSQQQSPGSPAGNKRTSIGVSGSKKRAGVKGPLSRRVNYLKNLYTQNTSSASSTIGDSDIELDDASSTVSSQFTMDTTGTSESSSAFDQSNSSDVANMSDFYDANTPMMDMEIQSFELKEENKPTIIVDDFQQNTTSQPQLVRPVSVVSNLSSLSSLNTELDPNLLNNSALCDNYLEQSYIQLKILCIEQIKKPGRDYSELFRLINNSEMTIRMRQHLIRELAYEATRFKRFTLIQYLVRFSNLLNQLANTTTPLPVTPNFNNATMSTTNQSIKTDNT